MITNPNIERLNEAIVIAEAALAALYAERDEAVDALIEETRQALNALNALKQRKSKVAVAPGDKPEYTGKRRGVTKGTRPVTPTMFTDEQIQDIREAYDTGRMSQKQLADIHGIRQPTVNKIVNRQSYKYVPERTVWDNAAKLVVSS